MAVRRTSDTLHIWPDDPEKLEESLRQANDVLSREARVPEEIERLVREIAESAQSANEDDLEGIDPYLLVSFDRGIIRSLLALELPATQRRASLRIGLEMMRQALRDVLSEVPVAETRRPREIASWLVDSLAVPQTELAQLIGVSPRTLQRWLSESDSAQPSGEDARRLRVVARIANHLRHALTSEGVVKWFRRPNAQLQNRQPAVLLERPEDAPSLFRVAAAARSSGGT